MIGSALIFTVAGLLSDMPPSKWQGISDRVTAPYDYTEGYHFLMKHLPSRYVFLKYVDFLLDGTLDSRKMTFSVSSEPWQYFGHRSLPYKCLYPSMTKFF